MYACFHSHQVLQLALVPALDREVDLSFWMRSDVEAVSPLCCHAHIVELEDTTVNIVKMQEFVAQVCVMLWFCSKDEGERDLIYGTVRWIAVPSGI